MDDWKTRVTKICSAPVAPEGTAEACLVCIYPPGPELGKRYELGEQTVIGRVGDCDIQVDRDSVSRKHARIERREERWTVVDLGSTNGTYVNDRPARDRVSGCELGDGDLIRVGSTIFKFLTGGNVETAYHEEIYRMTIIDGLTQVYNKRFLLDHLDRELARSGRSKRPLSLVMFDIDHFKKINDQHGHLTGDGVLKELAQRVAGRVRKQEVFARYGGEEFAVVLPEATLDQGTAFAEQLRQIVLRTPFVFDRLSLPVTISLGVATTEEELSIEDFIRRADENLYEAKRQGRNRVVPPVAG